MKILAVVPAQPGYQVAVEEVRSARLMAIGPVVAWAIVDFGAQPLYSRITAAPVTPFGTHCVDDIGYAGIIYPDGRLRLWRGASDGCTYDSLDHYHDANAEEIKQRLEQRRAPAEARQ